MSNLDYNIEIIKNNDLKEIEKIGEDSLPIYYEYNYLFYILKMDNFLCYKLIFENKIIGFVIIEILDNNSRFHIMSFAILKEYRKKGFGKKIIDFVKKKKKIITLNVQKSNEIALKFYLKNDFKVKKIMENYYTNLNESTAYSMEYNL